MVEMPDPRERGIERSVDVARGARSTGAAIGPAEFAVCDLALRPGARRVVEVRDAGRHGRPAPVGLLLGLHLEAQTIPGREQPPDVSPKVEETRDRDRDPTEEIRRLVLSRGDPA